MSRILRFVVAASAAVLLTAWQGAALGDSLSGVTRSISVQYSDLDLNRPADVRILYQRITHAAGEACGPKVLTGSQLPLPGWEDCVAHAIDAAVSRLDRPALSAYHREHVTDVPRKG